MNKEKVYGILCAMATVCIWGGVYVIKGYLLLHLSAFQINFFNAMITAGIYGMICLCKKTSLKISMPMAKRLMLAGVVGIMGSRVTCDTGIRLVGSVTASVFAALIPIMCVFYDVFYRKKKINRKTAIGVLISVVGVYIIVANGESGTFNLFGYACLFLSNAAWIFYSYICADTSKLPENRNVMLFYQFLGSFIVLSLVVGVADPINPEAFTHMGVVLGVIFLGIVNGVIAYTCFAYATKTVGVITTSGIGNCTPIMAMVWGLLFFGTTITLTQVVGVLLTVGAITMVTFSQINQEKA